MALQTLVLFTLCVFTLFSILLFFQHLSSSYSSSSFPLGDRTPSHRKRDYTLSSPDSRTPKDSRKFSSSPVSLSSSNNSSPSPSVDAEGASGEERKGLLKCDGEYIDSEVIYWKIVPGDDTYESPITPHHGLHHDRYITYEYDEGGWNNIRMSLECVMVMAHAMGRTVVPPPRQNLYLVDKKYKDKTGRVRSGMGFEDFFDMDLVKSHKGYHIMSSEEFLAKEGVTGGLHGVLPPRNSTQIGGRELNIYLRKVADQKPEWMGKFLAMPDASMNISDFNINMLSNLPESVRKRMKQFGGERTPVFYDKNLQNAHHIHFQGGSRSRLLQHHYAFTFFADKEMQSFYKRFVRDYLRYKDEIQCAGHEIVKMVREDARAHNRKMNNPGRNGGPPDDTYYALHVRRGDFQYKDVKISADQIVKNLIVDGVPVIPRGALVYLSTDDPKGVCKNCLVQRISCDKYKAGEKPPGCPEDPSWKGFADAGWTIRFLDDYLKQGAIPHANPNTYGMIESIVCSRSEVFAGTFYSTFTAYIHRMRGYHGIGEQSYYHSNGRVKAMRMKKSVGHGFSREWRAGWTDDEGGLI